MKKTSSFEAIKFFKINMLKNAGNKSTHRFAGRGYFFNKGLSFECQKCGACCTGSPGLVFVNKEEMEFIARLLNISIPALKEKYLYLLKNNFCIKEDSNGRCFFFEDKCAIYSARPNQCKSYPFWLLNLRSEGKWQSVSGECPGIGKGRLFTREEIIEIIRTSIL